MPRIRTTQTFLSTALAELGTLPRPALIGFGLVGALSAAWDFAFWFHRPRLTAWDYAGCTVLVGASLVLSYGVCMEMIGRRRSWGGLVRFLATVAAMVAPLVLGLVIIAMAPGAKGGLGAALACLLLAIFCLSFLQGWPVLQATSDSLVGPWAAFKATKGLRWPLFLASSLTGTVNRFVPSISTADNLAGAGLLAVLGGVVSAFSLMLAAAIAVTAWRHMATRAD